MQNIPAFTTDLGIASLTLSEIPYKQIAYIRIHDSTNIESFLKECFDFCRMAGAERIYAAGHESLSCYPVHTRVVSMTCSTEELPETDAALFPVQKNTLEKWRSLYNEKMCDVPNSAYMTQKDAQEYLKKGNAYFVHRNGELLGIGVAEGETIEALAATVPGVGEDVLLALSHALPSDRIRVDVATANSRGMKLYERLGFIVTEEISVWYKII